MESGGSGVRKLETVKSGDWSVGPRVHNDSSGTDNVLSGRKQPTNWSVDFESLKRTIQDPNRVSKESGGLTSSKKQALVSVGDRKCGPKVNEQ